MWEALRLPRRVRLNPAATPEECHSLTGYYRCRTAARRDKCGEELRASERSHPVCGSAATPDPWTEALLNGHIIVPRLGSGLVGIKICFRTRR